MIMQLDTDFQTKLNAVKSFMLQHEAYTEFMEQLDHDTYKKLQLAIEPYFQALFVEVAQKAPLQLLVLEDAMMDEELEGLYLNNILTYNVLRANVNEHFKFSRTPDRLQKIIYFICNSPSFEFLQDEIRLPLRLAFIMSSNIWGNKLAESVQARRSREYLLQQLQEAMRDKHAGPLQYKSLKERFKGVAYQSASMPEPGSTWKIQYIEFRKFIIDRINGEEDNNALKPSIYEILNEDFYKGTSEVVELLILLAHFFELDEDDFDPIESLFSVQRNSSASYNEQYFGILKSLLVKDELIFSTTNAALISDLLEASTNDDLIEFYQLMAAADEMELINEDFVAKVEYFSAQHRELVPVTSCLKIILLQIIDIEISEILNSDYTTLTERIYLYDRGAEAFLEASYREAIKEVIVEHLTTLMFFFERNTLEFKEIKKMVSGTPVDFNFISMKEIRSLYRQQQLAEKTKEK